MLLLFARDRFGEPPADVQAALEAVADVDRLEALAPRVIHVASWHELLGLPAPRRARHAVNRHLAGNNRFEHEVRYILMGVRIERALVQRLLQGVLSMQESVTYQAILEEGEATGIAKGKAEEARRMLLLFAR